MRSLGSAPGTRCGLGGPSAPALRASLRYSLRAGSAQTCFAQTRAALVRPAFRSSAEQQGFRPTRTAYRAPSLIRRAVHFSTVSGDNTAPLCSRCLVHRMHNDCTHVGGWFALGRQSSLRRAPQREADQGRTCLSRRRVCADPAFREEHREVRRTGGSAAPRQTIRRRATRTLNPTLTLTLTLTPKSCPSPHQAP